MNVSRGLPETLDLTQQEIDESTIHQTEWEGMKNGEKLYIKYVNSFTLNRVMSMTIFGSLFHAELTAMYGNTSGFEINEKLYKSATLCRQLILALQHPKLQTVNTKIQVLILYCFFNWLDNGSISSDITDGRTNQVTRGIFEEIKNEVHSKLNTYTGREFVPQLNQLRDEYAKKPSGERYFNSNASLPLLQTMDRLTNIMGILSAVSPTDQ